MSEIVPFVHLHTHSEYSLLEATPRVKQIAKKAAEMGMKAVALTDNGSMFGAIEFYFACKDNNVNPILGLDAYVCENRFEKKADRDAFMGPRRLVFLAQNIEGYRNLCQLSSIGYQEGFYWKPRIDYEVLNKYSEHLICLSGGNRGEITDTFLKEGAEAAEAKAVRLKEIFGSRFYIELSRTVHVRGSAVDSFLIELAQKLEIPLVAANDVYYLNQEDQVAQEVLICIGTNRTLQDEARFRLGPNEFYFKAPHVMHDLFSDVPEAIANTLVIADSINIKFNLKDANGKAIYHLPTFPTEAGRSLKEEIAARSFEGLRLRFDEAKERGEPVAVEQEPDYEKRLNYELSVIDKMGFNGYFLIVQDFINWAKNNNIPVGPGRGSGAGSLVAYSLRITDLDPLPNFLLFERFLNPERISMPDFDIDFCQDRRGEVINYVTQKYGIQSVSQIITYGKLQARAAIKDVGRVLGMTFAEVDLVTKLIPDKLGINLKESLEMEPRIREMMDMNPTVATLMDLAQRVEGLVRHAGIHAAGVIIADGELIRLAPLYKGADGENVVQYDMKHAEKIGLIKFDFLGLKTLTHINYALNLVKRNHGVDVKANLIPLTDPKIYELLSRGDTAGIFQFEGEGITDATRKIKPSSFADITAITSLYRPGPMANIPEYTKRKHKESPIEYLLEDTKQVLEETYGIMVYQEQVMGIASLIAGYSLGEADMLRRAMGKKIKEEMDQHRLRFLKGAKEKGHDSKRSEELFELMYKFADYGFNKSHAAAYSVITAQTAWIKHHYTGEFFAALLSTEINDTDKIVKYVKDCQKHGIKVLPPHINVSDYLFNVTSEGVFFGLGAIKGVGSAAVESILDARAKKDDKKFQSLEGFFESIDLRKVNKKVIESLIKAGAMDGFGFHRAQLMAGYSRFLDQALTTQKNRELGQSSFFDLDETADKSIKLPDLEKWGRTTVLAFEKEVLGFYLSDHPLNGFEKLAAVWTNGNLGTIAEELRLKKQAAEDSGQPQLVSQDRRREPKRRVILSGIMAEFKEMITKKGTRMAFGKLEDLHGSCELVIFPDVFAKHEADVKSERPLLVGGNLEDTDGAIKIIVDNMVPLEDIIKKSKRVVFNLESFNEDELLVLSGVLKDHPGTTPLSLKMKLKDYDREIEIDHPNISGVSVNNDLFEKIHSHFGRTDFLEIKNS
ncbi:MAG: DNA polymerase III subunit alpha [Bdellovibrionaceae bacterium]|nr:DNA polymerase III subunit alpha [Pseudobdellovibrionaceae bacterium]